MSRVVRLVEHRYTLPTPVGSAAGTWTERRALLVVVEDEVGHRGLGEAAPLPGYSQDTLAAARDALVAWVGQHELPRFDPEQPLAPALTRASRELPSAAARTALEAALLDLWSRQASAPAWSLLVPAPARRSPLAVWLSDGTEAALASARAAMEREVTAFKVKLDGRRGLEAGLETLDALRRSFGNVVLRADANRSTTARDLAPHLARLRDLELEWLEEPTAEVVSDPLGVPLALDESLQADGALPDLGARPFVAALVLKPTALGGLGRCLALGVWARQHARAAVASQTLEGPVGYMAAAALALALQSDRAHGLGPHAALRGFRPPALDARADVLVPWSEPGFGLTLEQALAGAAVEHDHRA